MLRASRSTRVTTRTSPRRRKSSTVRSAARPSWSCRYASRRGPPRNRPLSPLAIPPRFETKVTVAGGYFACRVTRSGWRYPRLIYLVTQVLIKRHHHGSL